MKQTRKGSNWHFGMKLHIGTDQRGIVHTVSATAAASPTSPSCRTCCMGRSGRCLAIRRTGRKTIESFSRLGDALPDQSAADLARPLSERWRLINRARSRTRARGEHAFRIVKQLWGFTKVRYRGLAKNLARAQTMFALANLYQLRRELLPAESRCVL